MVNGLRKIIFPRRELVLFDLIVFKFNFEGIPYAVPLLDVYM